MFPHSKKKEHAQEAFQRWLVSEITCLKLTLLLCYCIAVAKVFKVSLGCCYVVASVVNCFLLKCRKLRREDQETSDWNVSRISLLRTQAVGSCSHRNLILSNFTRLFYRQNWRRDFLEVETKHQIKQASEGNKPNESTSGQDKAICRTKVKSLSSLTH